MKISSYDSISFVESLLELAIEKQAAGHDARPEVTRKIRTRFEERIDEFPEIELYDQSNNLVKFHSTNPDHPETVRYTGWVVGTEEGRETMVRVSLNSDASEEEINALQSIVANYFDEIDGFDLQEDSTMWTARTTMTTQREKRPTNDEYIDEIVSELRRLVACYHPRFVEADL